jgi:ADP-ribose pyrophosphatase YjhB (NUDIX family)
VTDTAEFPPRPERPAGWLSRADIERARASLPILYVDAVPVRVDDSGDVVAVGILLRVTPEGVMSRALVSGRVMYHERVRDALVRHIEKDLGPMALPQIPPSPQPFTVAEYFPTPGVTSYHDPRQHAVSLAYIVPVAGDCTPQQDSLDLAWLTPEEATSEQVQVEMAGGTGTLLRQAMAHAGRLP